MLYQRVAGGIRFSTSGSGGNRLQDLVNYRVIREMEAGRVFREPIVTEITPAPEFYSAEEHHQEYFRNNASQPYCMFVVAPKLATFREKFSSKRKRQKPGTG